MTAGALVIQRLANFHQPPVISFVTCGASQRHESPIALNLAVGGVKLTSLRPR